MRKFNTSVLRFTPFPLAVVLTAFTFGQSEEDDDIVELSPFVVTTDSDVGYRSTNSTSGTSLNTAIKELPMAIQVINQEFIRDIGAANLEEALEYTPGVFTSDNQSSNSVGATRGNAGGGSGDRSISSAGSGDRFANVVYIRGLATPYQNRMGFRNGGVVVTANSAIALGGILDSSNIERIEVVKGPNSLLYGVGVLSGIVNVIPEKPLPEFRGEVGVQVGSYGFLRGTMDLTGPVDLDIVPGELNWRIAGALEESEDWTDFRSDETDYIVGQLEWKPSEKFGIFLEYQYGKSRINGVGSQWIIDEVNNANDTEFRNEFNEGFNWARHSGEIPELFALSNDYSKVGPSIATVSTDGTTTQATPAALLTDETFVGGGRGDDYRITGPNTFAERRERNFLADVTLIPFDGFTINAGAFITEQETEELNIVTDNMDYGNFRSFMDSFVNPASGTADQQLTQIFESNQLYGSFMQDTVRDTLGLNVMADPAATGGDPYVLSVIDDIRGTEYRWEHEVIKSKSQQYRLRGTYTFDAELLGQEFTSTFLAGYSLIIDDIDFPDGSLNRANASGSNDIYGYAGTIEASDISFDSSNNPVIANAVTFADAGVNASNADGKYFRSIANFDPIYLDGRNDFVNGHNTVRAGDIYLNQEITQEGMYFVYQGKFFEDRLEIIAGLRQDSYNAVQGTYKRVDITDDALQLLADDWIEKRTLLQINGTNQDFDEVLAANTADGTYVSTYYEEEVEGGNQGYFGLANRGGSPDDTYGYVPGSRYDVFDEDYEVTTGTIGLSYNLNDEFTIYGVLAQGVSPNTALRDGDGEIIDAEETFNKEIGIKFELLENKLSGSISFFEIERSNAIWDVALAPSASLWFDALTNPNRGDAFTRPAYDPNFDSTLYVRSDFFTEYLSSVTGIDADSLSFQRLGTQIAQRATAADFPNLGFLQRQALIANIQANTNIPAEFANDWNSQQPFVGAFSNIIVAVPEQNIDESYEVTLYDIPNDIFITETVSSSSVIYHAFSERNIDKTINQLYRELHPVRYRNFDSGAQPQSNNNVSFNQSQGALVTFDETIKGVEFEIFYRPTDNLEFIVGYAHTEREADDSFDFTNWRSISGTTGEVVSPYNMLNREYGWENAGIDVLWVDASAYEAAQLASADGIVALADIDSASYESIVGNSVGVDGEVIASVDERIAVTELGSRNAAGEVLMFVDRSGNFINENNSVDATDYRSVLSGVSLNFNPEDELSIFGKYSFDEDAPFDFLDGLSLTARVQYSAASETSIQFNSVNPLEELRITPQTPERYRFDFGVHYKWYWSDVSMRLSLQVYDAFNKEYEVNTETLSLPNPVTGETVTNRTERFLAPTTYRVGLTASF